MKFFFVYIIVEEYFFYKCIIFGFKLFIVYVFNGFLFGIFNISVEKLKRNNFF